MHRFESTPSSDEIKFGFLFSGKWPKWRETFTGMSKWKAQSRRAQTAQPHPPYGAFQVFFCKNFWGYIEYNITYYIPQGSATQPHIISKLQPLICKNKYDIAEKAAHIITNLNLARQVTWGCSGVGYLLTLIWVSISVTAASGKLLSFFHQGYFQNYNLLQMANFVRILFPLSSPFLDAFSLLTHIMPTRLPYPPPWE